MSVEMTVLTVIALLAASLWLPYIIGVNTSDRGSPADIDSSDFSRPADPTLQRPWVHRAYRAHLNLLEQAMPFAVMVIVAHLYGISTVVTVWTAVVFLILRLAHATGMITGMAGLPMRPIIFTLGWICCLIFGWQIFWHS